MNAIAVINVGDYMHPNARASIMAAAERWGCVAVEIKEQVDPLRHKFRVRVPGADRVLLMDADILIRSDCPDPFELVPPNRFGCVNNYQDNDRIDDRIALDRGAWIEICIVLGDKSFIPARMANGGFLLWTPDVHQASLDWLDSKLPARLSPLCEQSAWSWMFRDEAHFLPSQFNRIGKAVWDSPTMPAWVCHYAAYFELRGDELKRAKIRSTDWEA